MIEKILTEICRLKKDLEDYSAVEALDYIESYINILQREQPEVDYNKFEELFSDFCERNKGRHITSHDACMWFWELGVNARKKE